MSKAVSKKKFPLLAKQPQLVYLDSAATSQTPKVVLDAERRWAERSRANIHRGVYALSERSTAMYESARATTAKFLDAPDTRGVVFTKGTTEGTNAVSTAWAEHNLSRRDVILLTELEHHANIVPWQQLAKRRGLKLRWWPIDQRGQLTPPTPALFVGVKFLAITQTSNVLGTLPPLDKIIPYARKHGVAVLVDGAQSVGHFPISVKKLDCDFFVCSGHKMLGPTGIGVLVIHPRRFSELSPYQTGGDIIITVTKTQAAFQALPQLLEAGTPPIGQAIGLAAAADFLTNVGLTHIKQHLADLTAYAWKKMNTVPHIHLYGPGPKHQLGNISFTVDGIHPHDLATFLDRDHIAVRAGHHCAQPLHDVLGVPATARLSCHCYSTRADIDALVKSLKKIIALWPNSTAK